METMLMDAVCSFNPTFGQGMTVAAIESQRLDEVLRGGLRSVGKRFFDLSRSDVDVAWSMATGADLRFAPVQGKRPLGFRLMNGYMKRFHRVAQTDPVVARTVIEVGNRVARPAALIRPDIVARVLFGEPARTESAGVTRLEPAPSSGAAN